MVLATGGGGGGGGGASAPENVSNGMNRNSGLSDCPVVQLKAAERCRCNKGALTTPKEGENESRESASGVDG